MTWNDFSINAHWHRTQRIPQAETVQTLLTHSSLICHIICSGKAIALPGRATMQYNVHVLSTEDVIFCMRLFVEGAGALNLFDSC